MIRQIILITDGCSNVGISPVLAAAHALTEGIVVNVVGVVDGGELNGAGAGEIAETAKAGGGMSRIISTKMLAQTMQMMTRKTVTHTIHQMINKELQHILGSSQTNATVESLPPGRRAEVVRVIDDLGETAAIRVALLIDSSGSMKPKLRAVEEAIHDLLLSLQAREGRSEIAIFHFPGSSPAGLEIEMDVNWTKDLAKIHNLFYKLNMKGLTPTGPSLVRLVRFFTHGDFGEMRKSPDLVQIPKSPELVHRQQSPELGHIQKFPEIGKDGMLSDYVV